MTRSLSHFDRRILFCAGLLLPFALAACDAPKTGKTEKVGSVPEETPKAIPVGGLTPREPTTESTASSTVDRTDAEAVFKAGNYKAAKDLFADRVASKPDDVHAQYMLGMSAWKSGDLAKAEKAFDKVTAIDPTNLKAHLNAARVLLDANRDQEGLERVQKALALDSTSLDGLRVLARAQTKLGRYDDAVATYRQALIRDDRDVWTLNNLGMLYLELGDDDVALGPLARAVQLKSSAPVFQNNLGIALERAGYRVAAKQAYEAAVRADSTYGKAIGNLKRISAVVTDTTKDEPVNLKKVADLFRLEVGMWRDSATKTETPVTPPAKPDSLPPTEL